MNESDWVNSPYPKTCVALVTHGIQPLNVTYDGIRQDGYVLRMIAKDGSPYEEFRHWPSKEAHHEIIQTYLSEGGKL